MEKDVFYIPSVDFRDPELLHLTEVFTDFTIVMQVSQTPRVTL